MRLLKLILPLLVFSGHVYAAGNYLGLDNSLGIHAGHIFKDRLGAGISIRYAYNYGSIGRDDNVFARSYSLLQVYEGNISWRLMERERFRFACGIAPYFSWDDAYSKPDSVVKYEHYYKTESYGLKFFLQPEIIFNDHVGLFMRINVFDYGYKSDYEYGDLISDDRGLVFNPGNDVRFGLRWFF